MSDEVNRHQNTSHVQKAKQILLINLINLLETVINCVSLSFESHCLSHCNRACRSGLVENVPDSQSDGHAFESN